MVYDNEALAHGLLVWQGEANVYDKRFHYYAAAEKPPEGKQSFAVWRRLWGTAGDRQPFFFTLPDPQLFDLGRPQLDRLAVPETLFPRGLGMTPGARLELLGILSKEKGKGKK